MQPEKSHGLVINGMFENLDNLIVSSSFYPARDVKIVFISCDGKECIIKIVGAHQSLPALIHQLHVRVPITIFEVLHRIVVNVFGWYASQMDC